MVLVRGKPELTVRVYLVYLLFEVLSSVFYNHVSVFTTSTARCRLIHMEKSTMLPRESWCDLPKVTSGYPPRQRKGELKNGEVYDPEHLPIARLNFLLDDLYWLEDEGEVMLTRPQRQTIEAMRDSRVGDHPTLQAWARARLDRHNESVFRINTWSRVLASIVDIAKAHAQEGVDDGYYQREAQRYAELLHKRPGQTLTDEAPVSHSLVAGLRALVVKLKEELQDHGVADSLQAEQRIAGSHRKSQRGSQNHSLEVAL